MKKITLISLICSVALCLVFSALALQSETEDKITNESKTTTLSFPPDVSYSKILKSSSKTSSKALSSSKITPKTRLISETSKIKTISDSKIELPSVMNLKIQGKTITAEYSELTKLENPYLNDRLVYLTNNGDTLEYDAFNGKLLYYQTNTEVYYRSVKSDRKITEKEALAIAENFIKSQTHLDFKKYTFTESQFYENIQSYDFNYSRLYFGYKTADSIYVSIRQTGEIRLFSCNPYVFDKTNMKPIDENALQKKLEEKIGKNTSSNKYTIKSQSIGLGLNNSLMMCYTVTFEREVYSEKYDKMITSKSSQVYEFEI